MTPQEQKDSLLKAMAAAYEQGDTPAVNAIANDIKNLGHIPQSPTIPEVMSNLGTNLSTAFKGTSEEVTKTLEDPKLGAGDRYVLAAGKGLTRGATELGTAGLKTLGDVAAFSEYTDPAEKFVVDNYNSMMDYLGDTDIVKGVMSFATSGLNSLDEWMDKSPDHYRLGVRIKALPDAVLGGLTSNSRALFGDKLKKVGGNLFGLSKAERAASRRAAVLQKLRPDDWQQQGKSKVEGSWDNIVYDPTDFETELATFISSFEGFDPKRIATYNRDFIDNKISEMAQKLDNRLSKYTGKVEIDTDALSTELSTVFTDYFDSREFRLLGLSPQAEKQIQAMAEGAAEIVRTGGNSPLDLLNARRDVDKYFKNTLKEKYFKDPETISNKDKVLSILRNSINAKIFESVPDVDVKKSLREQHLLFRAHDMMSEKAKTEGLTAFGRLATVMEQATGLHISKTPVGMYASGVVAATVLGNISPALLVGTAGTAGLYSIGKLIKNSPTPKAAIGQLLMNAGKAIKEAKAAGDIFTYTMLTNARDEALENYRYEYGNKAPLK